MPPLTPRLWDNRSRSNFGALKAITAGSGPLVVLLHGVGLKAEAWNAQIDALSGAGYRVIAPDMAGHGASPSGPASVQQFAARAKPLLTEPAVIVGHSMGAMLALELAPNAKAVVALNAIYDRSTAAQAAVKTRADALDGTRMPDADPTLRRWFGDTASAARTACATWLAEMDPAAYKTAYSVFATSNGPTAKQLKSLPCPALFATGAAEPNSTPDMSRSMAELARQGHCAIIPDAAHMMPMTHADEVNALLLRFLQAHHT